MFDRPICIIGGCNKPALSSGNGYYHKLCQKHHREKYGMSNDGSKMKRKGKLRNESCILCGWKGPCDLHRLITSRDGGKYIKGNVITLCPNCHRLLHRGLLLIK